MAVVRMRSENHSSGRRWPIGLFVAAYVVAVVVGVSLIAAGSTAVVLSPATSMGPPEAFSARSMGPPRLPVMGPPGVL